METNLEISEDQAVLFLKGLKKELRINSTQRVISLVRFIVSKLRIQFTTQQLTSLVSKTPGFIHLLLIVNQDHRRFRVPTIGHVDELVDVLFLEDRMNRLHLFKTEIDALSCVNIVLTNMQNLFSRIGLEVFNYTLRSELSHAMR